MPAKFEQGPLFSQFYGNSITSIKTYLFFYSPGEAGGLLGLCIGASLLTVMEVFDLIISIIAIKLGCIATDSA